MSEGITVVKDIPDGDVTISDISYSYGRIVEGKNAVGLALWSLTHIIEWDVDNNGQWLTRAARYYTPYVAPLAIGWSFEGLIVDEQEGGAGWNYFQSDIVGHFKFEVLGQPVQNPTPRIWLQGWNDGTVYYQH